MEQNINFEVGNIIELKKKHPCGETRWEVIRTGADIKIKCLGCSRIILIERAELKKSLKTLLK